MNTAARLCVAIAMHFFTVGHAALQPLWTQTVAPPAGTTISVEVTKLDSAGDIIVAGSITETPTGSDLWVVKLDGTTGAIKWTFRKNGALNGNDKLGGVAIAANNDVFVAGALVNEPAPNGGSGFDAYMARLSVNDGVPAWQTPVGPGPVGDDAWHAIAMDALGNPVVTGMFTPQPGSFAGDARTAKIDANSGVAVWEQNYRAFETQMLDQGERVFVASDGIVYVQGLHLPGAFAGTNYDQTVLMLSYKEDGTPRFAVRYREGQNARAFDFGPAVSGGFVVGLSMVVPPGNTPTLTVSRGLDDGTPATEVPLPLVTNLPTFRLAENGDILFTGRGNSAVGEGPSIVAGRLAPGALSTLWSGALQPASVGPGIGFAHVDFLDGGSAVAGIGPGQGTPDLIVTTVKEDGAPIEQVQLDGAAPAGAPITDMLAAGPTMDSNQFGTIAVANTALNAVGDRITLVRRLRLFTPPTVALTNPAPADPNVTAFSPIVISATASDPDNDATRAEFFVDGTSVASVPTAPYEVPYTFMTTGTHTIEVIATDTTGSSSSTGPITVVAHVPTPVVTTGSASRTGPTTGLFDGTVANLPLGGTARFKFNFSGPTIGFGFSTEVVPVSPTIAAKSIAIPFTFPEPHRSYDYFLEITATDGSETIVQGSTAQSFLIPNAPIVAQEDFIFAPRGKILGSVLANDSDDDAGEALVVTFINPTLPGVFTALNGAFSFAPNREFTGESVLSYSVDDGHGSVVTESAVLRNGRHYAGLYHAVAPVNGTHLGVVNAVVSPAGRATISGYLNGRRFTGKGDLKQQPGQRVGFTVPIRRTGELEKQLVMSWDVDRLFTAELSEGSVPLFSADGIRVGVSPLLDVKSYAMLGTHTNVSGNAEGRVRAFASVRVDLDGRVRFRGKLGDGTPFSTVARTREDGRIPVYTQLKGRGASFLAGFLAVNLTEAHSDAPGMVVVQASGGSTVPTYAKDYRDLVAFSGPLFVPASNITPPLTFTAQPRMITLSTIGGGMDGLGFSLPIWLSKNGSISGITGITRISVDGVTGEFNGAFLPAGQRRTLSFSGILRPGLNVGVGVFRGISAAGEVELVPQ